MTTHLGNEQQLRKALVGTEAPGAPGVAVTPTAKWYGTLVINGGAGPLADYTEYDGSYDADITEVRGPIAVDGTYNHTLSFEDWPIYLRYGVDGQVAGVTDGQSTPGYTYSYIPSSQALDTATVESGFPGMAFLSTLLHWREFTVSADIDDAEASWKWTSSLLARTKTRKVGLAATAATAATATVITKTGASWTVNAFQGAFIILRDGALIGEQREILSNTATTITVVTAFSGVPAATVLFEVSGNFTAGVPDRTRERIPAPGTKLYLDDTTIGTTQVLGKFISFSHTHQNNTSLKRFMEDITTFSTRVGRGMRRFTGQIRMEFDDWAEYDKWVLSTKRLVRIEQTGSVINVSPETKKLARIEIPNAKWDVVSEDVRESNITATFSYRGYKDAVAGYVAAYTGKNALATLP